MRITNSMMMDNVLSNLNSGMERANVYNMQLSSNRRITRLSDDSIGVLNSMTARQRIRDIERYQSNIVSANNWNTQAETAITDIQSILKSTKEDLIGAISTKSDADKKNYATLFKELKGHLIQTANTTIGNQYVFAGYNSTKAPFEKDATGKVLYNGLDLETPADPTVADAIAGGTAAHPVGEANQINKFEIGYGMTVEAGFTGIDLVGTGDDNLFKIYDDLIAALDTGADNAVLSGHIAKIDGALDRSLALSVQLGARTTKLELMDNRYSVDAIDYESIRGSIEDIDQSETIMKMKYQESIYRQALAVGARVIQPTLMDFLR